MERELRISINLDNSIFEDNEGGEVSRILRDLIRRIESESEIDRDGHVLYDSNGNRVGEATIIKRD